MLNKWGAYMRLAQTILSDGTILEREWTVSEQYQLYRRGFKHGASLKSIHKEYIGIEAYNKGYSDGSFSIKEACQKYANSIGYEPSILRIDNLERIKI